MEEKKKYIRPAWDDYFMAIAKIVGTRSDCDRLRSGVILVQDKRIISTGYNGAPPGLEDCDTVGHLMEEGHCVRTIHGEHNVILQAAIIPGASTQGATMYTKYSPCLHCSKYLIAAGIKRVVIGKIYRNAQIVDYLKKAGVQVDLYKENEEINKIFQELFTKEIETMNPVQGNVVTRIEK